MQFRTVTPDDYASIIAVVDSWWGGRAMAAMLPRLFFEHFRDTSFVAEVDGTLVGFLIGFFSPALPSEAYPLRRCPPRLPKGRNRPGTLRAILSVGTGGRSTPGAMRDLPHEHRVDRVPPRDGF